MLSRRIFIRHASLATFAVGMSSWEKPLPPISLQLYTIRDQMQNLPQAFAQVKAAGYDNIELYGYNNRKYFDYDIASFSKLMKANGLKTNSGHYDAKDMLHSNTHNWDSWKYILEDAHTLGQRYVVVPWVDVDKRTTDDFKRIAERLNRAAELSKDAGILTGYHNHDFEFQEKDGEIPYDLLLKNTDPALVVFEMDIYWVSYAGHDPLHWFAKHPGRFQLWHLKDMETAIPGVSKGQTCELGKGVIDWKKIFSAQRLAGLNCAFVEQEQYRRPVFECISESARYLRANKLYVLS